MRFFGGVLMAIGLFSAAVHFLGMHLIFLNWLNRWGTPIDWYIRGGIFLVGLICYLIGKPSYKK